MKSLLKHYTILYVEDDVKIQQEMKQYLEAYFKTVYTASDGEEGLEVYECYFPDVLLLDIDLPKMDGLTLAKRIREENSRAIIVMLTAFTDKEKLLAATELKLVKYLVKPVDLAAFNETMELVAKELLQNTPKHHALGESYCWDADRQVLLYRDETVPLSTKEQKLLKLLVQHRNEAVSYEDIMAEVWEDEFEREISINCVKNIVSDLRKKLPKDAIKNVYGKGYMLR